MQVICKRPDGTATSFDLKQVPGKTEWCWEPATGHIVESGISLDIMRKPATAQDM